MIPISICIIGKNEEKHLPSFFSSIRKHFPMEHCEMVYVDTGSVDTSVSIAENFGAKVFHFPWISDFSAARNYSLSVASYDRVLVLDCDEYIRECDFAGMQKMISLYPKEVGMLSMQNCFLQNGIETKYTDELERFFDRRYYHYEGIVHEQVRRKDGREYKRIALPLTAFHSGYNGSSEELQKKAQRNIDLLLTMLEKDSTDPYLYFQLGQSYHLLKDEAAACHYYGKGLEYDVNPKAEFVQLMVVGYGYSLLNLEKYKEALSFTGIYEEFSSVADFVCLMGLIYLRNGMIEEAIREFKKAATFPNAKTEGANSYVPNFNLGCIYEVLGDTSLARNYYEKCENFPAAQKRLEALYSE